MRACRIDPRPTEVVRWDDADPLGGDLPYEQWATSGTSCPAHRREGGELAQIFFTSGTTGEPKVHA